MKKFWNFIRNDTGERILRLEGPIDEDSFWGDEVTPRMFREELEAEEGNITVWINSPGGNVFAAAEIYTMLCEYKGKVTVKIDAIAASAASVIAMAGERVLMSPVAMLMIHDPMTIAMGNTKDMEKAIGILNEVKESIINAYQKKTGLSRSKIGQLMENESWMNARKAVELGFADAVLYSDKGEEETADKSVEDAAFPYSTRIMCQTILNRYVPDCAGSADNAEEQPVAPQPEPAPAEEQPVPEEQPAAPTVPDADPDTPAQNPDTAEETHSDASDPPDGTEPPAEETPKADDQPEMPVIGMDGKTKDGAMPFALVMKQLELLK